MDEKQRKNKLFTNKCSPISKLCGLEDMGKIYSVLITLYLPTSVCILSTLFSIHFPWY